VRERYPTVRSVRRFASPLAAYGLLIVVCGCTSASPAAQKVRITQNPEAVKGCRFLGNVKATSGWGGAAMSGVGAHNAEVALQEKTAKLGGDVLFVVASGTHASGEAYDCSGRRSIP
jgi:Domain of unknown function (DUF4156)